MECNSAGHSNDCRLRASSPLQQAAPCLLRLQAPNTHGGQSTNLDNLSALPRRVDEKIFPADDDNNARASSASENTPSRMDGSKAVRKYATAKEATDMTETSTISSQKISRKLLSSTEAEHGSTSVSSTEVATPRLCAATVETWALSVNGTNLVDFMTNEFNAIQRMLILLVGSSTKSPTMSPTSLPTT